MSHLLKNASAFFFTEIFSDEEGIKISSTYLKTILYVTLVILPVLIAYKIFYFSVLYPVDYILFSLVISIAVLLRLANKGRVKLASSLFIIATWIALTLLALFSDGVKDVSVVGYIVVIFLATLLIGARFALIVTILSILSVWGMAFFPPKNGFMPPGDIPVVMSIDYTLLFIAVIAIIILFARSYHYSFERINRELQERIKAEKKLSENETALKEKNEELNRSNIEMARINEELLTAKEKAEESDRLKSAFIQNISHEIRTPMNGIVGFLDLLQQTDSDDRDKKAEYIEIINSCTNQLSTLVNDFIDISKLETGNLQLNISEYQSDQIIRDIDASFSKLAKDKGLFFTIINEIGNIKLKSDPGKIKQVLDNLVSNAIKFTARGGVKVTLSRLKDNIIVSVADTGIGIREGDKEIIFDRFRQAEIGLNRPFGGSGLGLAISKGNIEFLGGKIWFESKPEKGSVFTFAVPVDFIV
jgi:signal transduction histidine kinase